MYEIRREREHYTVYKDGIFYCSADNIHEAEHDIEEAEKGCSNCVRPFRGSNCVNCTRNIVNHLSTGIHTDNWLGVN